MALILVSGTMIHGAETKITATEILDRVVRTLQEANSIDMKASIQNGGNVYNASIVMSKEKFRYGAGNLNVYYDGKTQWTIDHDFGEVSITEPTPDEITETNPLAFVKSYKNNYKVSLLSSSGGTYTVRMVALKKSSYVRTAQVVISASSWLPTHVTAQLASGQTLTLRMLSASVGTKLSDGSFRYDNKSNPSYEIIDLR